MKQPYNIAHSRSFRKAAVRAAGANTIRSRVDKCAAWGQLLNDFKLNRKSRKRIRSLINASKH